MGLTGVRTLLLTLALLQSAAAISQSAPAHQNDPRASVPKLSVGAGSLSSIGGANLRPPPADALKNWDGLLVDAQKRKIAALEARIVELEAELKKAKGR